MRRARLIAAIVLCAFMACAAEVPRPAPELTINIPNGKPIRLSEYRGKTVLLAFILTTCSHCQAVTRGLVKDYAELGPKGLQVIEVAIEDMAATAVPGFKQLYATNFPVGYATNHEAVGFLQHPRGAPFLMPALVFIDKTGVIRAQWGGGDEALKLDVQEKSVRDTIIEVMSMPAPAAPKQSPARKSGSKKTGA